ncbi:MAG: 2-isopropylmalate synthase [Spirochaetales bacterium]|nr:2-isopropylmalate synthase [Spirochaetales bacterium]
MPRTITIFDTTLRDGEQAPGCSMNLGEKIEVARQLATLGVDVIEAGFAIASPGDFISVREIARSVRGPIIASLSRALEKDIDQAWEAIRDSERPRIHTFIATSPIHMEHKLKMSPEQVVEQTRAMVRYARNLCADVEFSAEDASRSDPAFLCRVFQVAIEEGATTINVPDTVGYSVPDEFAALVRAVREGVPDIDKARISVHCHDDLGLAVANSLAAIKAGAEQVECTVNGLGERAGNAALEEIVMALKTRAESFDAVCSVRTTELHRTSRLVSTVTGVKVQPNKAIVGGNAFAHEAGIHQHGMLANKATYEIMTPESIGLPHNEMVLGKHSGRHAFEERLESLGLKVDEADMAGIFAAFKELADKKKVVSDRDIEALALGRTRASTKHYALDRFVINAGTNLSSTSVVRLAKLGGSLSEHVAVGDGPIDASFKAIDKIVGRSIVLSDFSLGSVTEGKDAQGEALVRISVDGEHFNGRGLSTDVVEASIQAYIAAINSMVSETGVRDAARNAP